MLGHRPPGLTQPSEDAHPARERLSPPGSQEGLTVLAPSWSHAPPESGSKHPSLGHSSGSPQALSWVSEPPARAEPVVCPDLARQGPRLRRFAPSQHITFGGCLRAGGEGGRQTGGRGRQKARPAGQPRAERFLGKKGFQFENQGSSGNGETCGHPGAGAPRSSRTWPCSEHTGRSEFHGCCPFVSTGTY